MQALRRDYAQVLSFVSLQTSNPDCQRKEKVA